MGMKLKSIASGLLGTVSSHSLWLLTWVSPPLFTHITVIPWNYNVWRCRKIIICASKNSLLFQEHHFERKWQKTRLFLKIEQHTSFAQTDVEPLNATICGPKTSKAAGTCVFFRMSHGDYW